jgi:hypothetical protein
MGREANTQAWHTLDVDAVAERLDTDRERGLPASEATGCRVIASCAVPPLAIIERIKPVRRCATRNWKPENGHA